MKKLFLKAMILALLLAVFSGCSWYKKLTGQDKKDDNTDTSVASAPQTIVIFQDDFESGMSQWGHEHLSQSNPHSGKYCFSDSSTNYVLPVNGVWDWITSDYVKGQYDFRQYKKATFKFWARSNNPTISNCGFNFITSNSGRTGISLNSGNLTTQWKEYTLDLGMFCGLANDVNIYFETHGMPSANASSDYSIDDIVLEVQ